MIDEFNEFCWTLFQAGDAFNVLGLGVSQQLVIALAVITALTLFAIWRWRTRHDKYNPWGDRDEG